MTFRPGANIIPLIGPSVCHFGSSRCASARYRVDRLLGRAGRTANGPQHEPPAQFGAVVHPEETPVKTLLIVAVLIVAAYLLVRYLRGRGMRGL